MSSGTKIMMSYEDLLYAGYVWEDAEMKFHGFTLISWVFLHCWFITLAKYSRCAWSFFFFFLEQVLAETTN